MYTHLSRLYDLYLKGQAVHYDLWHGDGRKRSVRALNRLFFGLVRITQPELFIEAGAKDARSSLRAKELSRNSRVVAFEANPYNVEHYAAKHDYAALGVEYRHMALADGPQELPFYIRTAVKGKPIQKLTGRSSILKRLDPETEYEAVAVPADSIDNIFAGDPATTCAMWIDVEGASKEVLTGGSEWVSKATCVMIEVEDSPKWENQWLSSDVMHFMLERGLVPIARDFEYKLQYNVVFAKDSVLSLPAVRTHLDYFHSVWVNAGK